MSHRRNLGGGAMPRAPFPGRGAFPSMKGAKERVGIPITQKEGNPVQFNGTLFEIVVCQLTPGAFYKLLKSDVPIVKSALQRACAHAEFARDIKKRRAFSGQRTLESVLHLLTHVQTGISSLEFAFQLGPDRR